jgi:hypothetical protein
MWTCSRDRERVIWVLKRLGVDDFWCYVGLGTLWSRCSGIRSRHGRWGCSLQGQMPLLCFVEVFDTFFSAKADTAVLLAAADGRSAGIGRGKRRAG